MPAAIVQADDANQYLFMQSKEGIMTAERRGWLEMIAFLFTPEDSTLPGMTDLGGLHAPRRLDPVLGHVKAVFWIILAIAIALVISAI